MSSIKDPEGAELQALAALADFDGKRVLEIGCGNGRLTRHYAKQAATVLGIDPDRELIETARAQTPPELADRLRFDVADARDLRQTSTFDVAFLSWSL